MRIGRRALMTLAAATTARQALAQEDEYPSRTIRLVVPRAPGGGSDIIARLLTPSLSARLGQTVVVENRSDAAAVIGTELVSRARPDGYTLYLADNAFYFNPSIQPNLPYDTLRDFSAVTMLAQGPVILIVNAAVPARNLAELVALAKAQPGTLTFASGGIGSSTHFAGVLLNLQAGIDTTHVPFRSSGPALSALLSGQVTMQFGGISSARKLIESGEIRAIALTGEARDPSMPDVPTFTEAGVSGVDVNSYWGMHAPANTPLAIRRKLRDLIAASMREPELNRRLREAAYSPVLNTPEEHQAQTNAVVAKWIEIGKRVNLNT
ncbi:Bug family tripartite tricarboxylate transporter substrate binding protein [Siccirubricoccus phaeus]|uniref:Bug family tripartite tricarboxylate transporter substrate binding protein n=1 Tax=Siccirubricoccus phaeus TaxID=2595053 RepID=UPI0011F35ABE|nr:tripartite tricarboxylate transporter substrate binding protein [Siccirubricoccus phaeus]